MRHFLYILIWAALLPLTMRAQHAAEADSAAAPPRQDSVVVSLLTCTPGELIYELYGHTAIRVREVGANRQSDWVFNYGTFSFEQPNFKWRFMLGQTDYELGVVPYAYFYESYVREGRGITEQRLNLRPDEARKLVDALSHNLLPENATYRYNFFHDNCVTRAVDMIVKAVDGKIVWPEVEADRSLRDIVHEYSEPSPWNKFGQDLLVGAEADRPAGLRGQMFAPGYAERFVAEAKIQAADGTIRHLAAPAQTLLPAQPKGDTAHAVTPLWLFGALFVVAAALGFYEYRTKRVLWGLDVILFLAQGFAGLIVAFLFFFSEHPAVGSNWLVLVFNPLPLLYLPWFMKAMAQGRRPWGLAVQLVFLLVATVAGLAGWQNYPPEVYLIILTLAQRARLLFLSRQPSENPKH